MNIKTYGCGVFTVSNVLSKQFCEDYIHNSELIGYTDADVRTLEGPKMLKSIRNNDRIIFKDSALATSLFDKVEEYLPSMFEQLYLDSLNEQFRLYKYSPGQYFKWHKDGAYETDTKCSCLTLMLYLNSDYTGGETEFRWDKIIPETGMILVFPHKIFHQGAPVITGTKYVLRTDVMYS